MRNCKKLSYTDKIKWRIRILWMVLAAMLVYMVTVAELGGGDSRIMTGLAKQFSSFVSRRLEGLGNGLALAQIRNLNLFSGL